MKVCFDRQGIECFVPMRYEIEETGLSVKEKIVPAIHNLIFVHSTQEVITRLKMEKRDFSPLRYIMKHSDNGEKEIMTVPEDEMNNFIKATSIKDSSVFFLDVSDYISKIGKRVRITAGQFKDVIGTVKRIKKNRCVVVQIQGVAAMAIANVPSRFVEEV